MTTIKVHDGAENIGSVDESRLIPLVHESERALHREINYTLMNPGELKKRQRTGDSFVKNVMKEPKIMIIRTCND